MQKPEKDKNREERIMMEVVVDAHDSEERAMGWYYYVADECSFPFNAKCTAVRRTSPLKIDDEVIVENIAPEKECKNEILVDINWQERVLAVPLSQLKGFNIDEDTKQAIEDWQYWFERGNEF